MSIRYIFNTSGEYVAFVADDHLFNVDSDWLGIILNGNEIYNTDGLFIGFLQSDDRIVRERHGSVPRRVAIPSRPSRPLRPVRPMRRLRMPSLPTRFEDAFGTVHAPIQKITPSYQIPRFEHLIGASIIAADGQFLGLIINDRFHPESVLNEFGQYGGQFSQTSIFNEFGQYGGQFSQLSPFNKFSTNAPRIVKDGQTIGFLTVNEFVQKGIDANEVAAWINTL